MPLLTWGLTPLERRVGLRAMWQGHRVTGHRRGLILLGFPHGHCRYDKPPAAGLCHGDHRLRASTFVPHEWPRDERRPVCRRRLPLQPRDAVLGYRYDGK